MALEDIIKQRSDDQSKLDARRAEIKARVDKVIDSLDSVPYEEWVQLAPHDDDIVTLYKDVDGVEHGRATLACCAEVSTFFVGGRQDLDLVRTRLNLSAGLQGATEEVAKMLLEQIERLDAEIKAAQEADDPRETSLVVRLRPNTSALEIIPSRISRLGAADLDKIEQFIDSIE